VLSLQAIVARRGKSATIIFHMVLEHHVQGSVPGTRGYARFARQVTSSREIDSSRAPCGIPREVPAQSRDAGCTGSRYGIKWTSRAFPLSDGPLVQKHSTYHGTITRGDLVGTLDGLRVECSACRRSGLRVITEFGEDLTLPEFRASVMADCRRRSSVRIAEHCQAVFPDLADRHRRFG
jgi:hypothetical protein